MSAPKPSLSDPHGPDDTDGVAAVAGAAVTGLVLAMGFVALMARVGGPAPAKASAQPPSPAMAAPAPAPPERDHVRPGVPGLYDETGAH